MFRVSKKTIIGGVIGNALETYDYIIWGLFSIYLSHEFLPPNSSLSDIFLLFLITYILRPIGGVLGGILADQIGRKKTLMISIFLMGVCTSAVGVLPSYAQLGIGSALLLITIRLMQVLAVGSEYISSICLLIESCEKNRKGYFGSWAAFGVNTGMLISSLLGVFLLYLMDKQVIPEWSWRLSFIFAFVTMLFGIWIRKSIPESLEFMLEPNQKRSIFNIFHQAIAVIKSQFFKSVLVFFLVVFGVSATQLVFIYSPIHMMTVNKLQNTQSFLINTFSLMLLIALIPFFGLLSDKFGRKKTLFLGIITLLIYAFPYFKVLSLGTFYQVLCAHILMAIPCANIFAITPVLITEIFPIYVRCSVTNLIYSIAACIGGGLIPLMAIKFGKYNGTFPGLILIMLGAVSAILLTIYAVKSKRAVDEARQAPCVLIVSN